MQIAIGLQIKGYPYRPLSDKAAVFHAAGIYNRKTPLSWNCSITGDRQLRFLNTPSLCHISFIGLGAYCWKKMSPVFFVWSHIGPQWCFSGVSHSSLLSQSEEGRGGRMGAWTAMCARWNTDSCLWPPSYTGVAIDTFQVHYVLWLQWDLQKWNIFKSVRCDFWYDHHHKIW